MSDAIKKLHDYLAMSPSVVYPEDVLAYLHAIEDENAKLREQYETVLADYRLEVAKLRELVRDMYEMAYPEYPSAFEVAFADRMCELGVEVGDGQQRDV